MAHLTSLRLSRLIGSPDNSLRLSRLIGSPDNSLRLSRLIGSPDNSLRLSRLIGSPDNSLRLSRLITVIVRVHHFLLVGRRATPRSGLTPDLVTDWLVTEARLAAAA